MGIEPDQAAILYGLKPTPRTASQKKATEVYDALVEMQARPTTSNDDATVLIEAASFVAAVRDGRAVIQ